MAPVSADIGNSVDKLHHPRSDAYSAEQVLLNKQQIWCGGADLHCYPYLHCYPDFEMLLQES